MARNSLRIALASYFEEPSTLDQLAQTAKPLSYNHHELVWTKGASGTIAYALEGAFDVIHNQVVVDTVGARQFFGISSIFGKPHGEDIRARRTDKSLSPEILLWDTDNARTRDLFCSVEMLKVLLDGSQALIHHLNELQVLHRRKRGAVAHIASHIRRLVNFRDGSCKLQIGQQELGMITGYDQRTIRFGLSELMRIQCIGRLSRSEYCVDIEALTHFIEIEKTGGPSERPPDTMDMSR